MENKTNMNASQFTKELNDLLGDLYRNVQLMESSELKRSRLNLTIGEIHLIELIGKAENGISVSEIANCMRITRPSVTVAVNKLTAKGYCEKRRIIEDGRSVMVHLTAEGQRVDAFHRRCHRNMVAGVVEHFTDNEKRELLDSMTRINNYFLTKL